MSSDSDYVVVIRAGSRMRFLLGEKLQVGLNIGESSAILTFQTRYSEEGYQSIVPRELWIDARGPADSLNGAVESFTNAAMFFATVISFCANGHSGDCRFHLAYDATPSRSEREFFEQFIEEERGLPLPSRIIKPPLVVAVINALGVNPHKARLRRAIVQYGLSLRYWSKGAEILSVAHLYMGMESLVPIVHRAEQDRLSLGSTEELAAHFGVAINELDGTIRRRFLFRDDIEVHSAAKKASDGVEHGFLDFSEVRLLAISVRDKVAQYLRQSIIDLLGVPDEVQQELLAKPYDKPIGTEGYIRYLRGHLLADHNNLAENGREYPIFEEKFDVTEFSTGEKGELNLTFSQSMTARLGEGVTFRPESTEVYGPEGIVVTSRDRQEVEPNIERQDTEYGPKSQDELATLLKDLVTKGKVKEILIKTDDGHVFSLTKDQQEQNG